METTKPTNKTNKMPKDSTKSRKVAAKAEVVVPVAAPAPAPVETPVVVAPAVVESRSADAILTSLQDTLKALSTEMTSRVREAVREALEASKAMKREARDSKRRHRKNPADMTPEERERYEARRKNNAFLKLRPISDELSAFMGLPPKSQRSQTDVTKFISNYVKTHTCFDPNMKRRIIPDSKLSKLLRVKDSQEVTYLNLQSFLKVHFLKPAA